MNAIFCTIFVLSAIILCITSPNSFLPALLDGAKNAIQTSLTLFCIYCAWMGISAVAEDCGINRRIAQALTPLCRRIFKTKNQPAAQNLAMNLSCNLLGLGGAATPFAVKAIDQLEGDGNIYAQDMLFIINSTSIQLVPTTVIALRAAEGSLSAGDITLPSFAATALSTLLATGLYFLLYKIKGRGKSCPT